jgi:hypothetical protein
MPDSHYYVEAAMNNSEVCAWPIGYSKILEWIHFFTHRDWAIVTLQYIILESAVLFFYFSIRYLISPGKWVGRIILLCLLTNPFILCISNYVLTDSLFAALTVIWFTLTLWYFYKPKPVHVYALIILIFLLFSLRYYAIFYPIITVPVILFSRIQWWVKISGLWLGCLLFFGFVRYTDNLFEKLTGQREFSPFSGWQLAGNALIMYCKVPHREADSPPVELQSLHQLVLHDLEKLPPTDEIPGKYLGFFFTWNPHSPLMKYNQLNFWGTPTVPDLRRWALAGQLYHDYGAFLIKRHPIEFARYFVGRNLCWFIQPIVDVPNVYPEGGVRIRDTEKTWFEYPSNWVRCSTSPLYSLAWFPPVVTGLNALLILGVIGFFYGHCHKSADSLLNKAIALTAIFWLLNFLFVVVTAPVMLRYALSGMIVNLAFVPMLMERIFISLKATERSPTHL